MFSPGIKTREEEGPEIGKPVTPNPVFNVSVMRELKVQARRSLTLRDTAELGEKAVHWARYIWRPAATLVALALILLLGWGVVNGKHGLSAWRRQRLEERALRAEIEKLRQENATRREHVEQLQRSDAAAIEHEARERLHYARPGEVIYTLPAEPGRSSPPADGR